MKEFFLKNEQKLIILAGFILVASLSWMGGYLQGKSVQDPVVVIEKVSENPKIEPGSQIKGEEAITPNPMVPASPSPFLDKNQKNCLLVGSKNSNKYHLSTCQWAKRIKPENLVCFSSEEEAIQKGYQADKGCIK